MENPNRIVIDEENINKLMYLKPSADKVHQILQKAMELKGLDLEDAAYLLNIDDDDLLSEVFKTAKELKEKIYGKRIVLFAPLYLSNYCVNNCLYCAFRVDNKEIVRKRLSVDEAVNEVKAIIKTGHKRIILVAGEDTNKCGLDYIQQIIDKIYEQKVLNGEIRRLNINMAPLSVEDFQRLAKMEIGTFQSFQETYHKETYKQMHVSGLKSNYKFRVETMDRALEAGLNDVGMGVLFGLVDYRFEVLALLSHCQHLDKKFGVGPHTLSIPRIEPAQGSDLSNSPPHAVDDKNFKKIIAVLRLAVPYTGIVLSTRERASFRKELLEVGVSQISAGSKTNPGGYEEAKDATEQFTVGDTRSLDEVIKELIDHDFIPSFCTSCYRKGRVGKDFMELAKPGLIQKFCQPNALFTFKEYLTDYASPATKEAGLKLIDKYTNLIEDEKVREKLKANLAQIDEGERDIYV